MNTVKKLEYVLGPSQREIQRLIYKAAILRPVTERLLRNVKIGPGVRVLDSGCGAGDVSMLAAKFVGPTGSFIQNPKPLLVDQESIKMAAKIEQFSYADRVAALTHEYLELGLPLNSALRAAEVDLW